MTAPRPQRDSLLDALHLYEVGSITRLEAFQLFVEAAANLPDDHVAEDIKALLETPLNHYAERTPEERKLPRGQRPPRKVVSVTTWGAEFRAHIATAPADGDDDGWSQTFEIGGSPEGYEERRKHFRRGIAAIRRAYERNKA